MSPPSIGDTPMTGAERQARYRASRADGIPVIRSAVRPIDAAGSSAGVTPSAR